MSYSATMLYDGDCAFCQRWIDRWRGMTRDKVRYVPYQKVLGRYPQVTEKQCQYAVQLILSDGKVFSGAHAVLKALSLSGRWGFCLWLYGHVPLFDRVSEFIYQMVATHRSLLSRFYGSPQCRR